ncbi:MAG: class II fumarate hydratase, partial [Pseudomonadota bacterium]|nr:class II fumarate hydratase [Pseudomonadota bacterium]
WGPQTQRAVDNFQISDYKMPTGFIRSLALLKWGLANANKDLNLLSKEKASAIADSAMEIYQGDHMKEFPVDVFQTGSGTSTNMNMNEVISHLASSESNAIHPNDDVNMGQSSNDVIPSAINVDSSLSVKNNLIPSMKHLKNAIDEKAKSIGDIPKNGRTHLMDAMPVTFSQEMSAWSAQIQDAIEQYEQSMPKIQQLAIGGTAVGTGINADPHLSEKCCKHMNNLTGMEFKPANNSFQAISSQDAALILSSSNKTLAVALTKISNDLRWMNSGPLGGLGEITLPALQPGSSIMPGKVNPVIPESVCMVAGKVIGNDLTITHAAQSGNFQLNVMLPLVAHSLSESLSLLSNACLSLADKAIKDFEVNQDNIESMLSRNPILATALNATIGYETGAQIVKKAYQEKRSIIEVATEMTDLDSKTLAELLDPVKLTRNQ